MSCTVQRLSQMRKKLSLPHRGISHICGDRCYSSRRAQLPFGLAIMAESANVVCAENISLLYLLNQIPSPPTVNTPPLPINLPDRYTLPFAAERSLASTLAFLSSITDSPRCITAICVQEQRGGDSLEIYVAINKRNPKDNNATLDTICGQFNQIFERLSGPGRGT